MMVGMDEQAKEHRVPRARWVRLVVSALSLISFVLLVALWIRSYRIQDNITIQYSTANSLFVASTNGRISATKRWPMNYPQWVRLSHTNPGVGYGSGYPDDFGKTPNLRWFHVLRWKSGIIELSSPLWILATISAAIFALTRSRRQFGLRAILIGITLIALALGLGTLPIGVPYQSQERSSGN